MIELESIDIKQRNMGPARLKPVPSAAPSSSTRRPHSKQKTSTPSRSRIEHYLSPGDISKIVASPTAVSHSRNLDPESSALEESDDGNRRSPRVKKGQRSTGADDTQRGSLRQTGKKQKYVESEEESLSDTVKKRKHLPTTSKKPGTTSKSSTSDGGRRDRKRTSSLTKATIDKFLSPERSSSLVSTPTRFPRRGDVVDREDEDEEDVAPTSSSDDEEDKTQNKSHSKRFSQGKVRQPKGFKSVDSSSSPADSEVPSTSREKHLSKSKGSKRKSSDSVPTSASKKQKAQKRDSSDDSENDEVSISRIKASANFMASGDVQTHMGDKDFLSSQVHTMSKLFSVDAGPRKWIRLWKAKQSLASEDEDEESEDLPEKVIHKAMSKLNTAMNSELGRLLSRHRQRKVLMSLDEIRRQEQKRRQTQGGSANRRGSLRIGASLEEILDHYPSEWPDDDDIGSDEESSERMEELTNRYAELRSRLAAASETLAVKEAEHKRLQDLHARLKDIDANLKQCTNNSELKEELNRTKSLVSQILKKLTQRRSPRKQKTTTSSTGHPRSSEEKADADTNQNAVGNHQSLVKQLFDSTV